MFGGRSWLIILREHAMRNFYVDACAVSVMMPCCGADGGHAGAYQLHTASHVGITRRRQNKPCKKVKITHKQIEPHARPRRTAATATSRNQHNDTCG